MAEWWPIFFSLGQLAQAAACALMFLRISRVLALKPQPFSHIVCKPGDVVCIALPVGLSSKALERLREEAGRFEEDTGVKLRVFADGIQVSGAVR